MFLSEKAVCEESDDKRLWKEPLQGREGGIRPAYLNSDFSSHAADVCLRQERMTPEIMGERRKSSALFAAVVLPVVRS